MRPTVGQASLLLGAMVVLVGGFLTWFWGEEPSGGIRRETAWDGWESAVAVLTALLGGMVTAVACVKGWRAPGIGLTALIASLASAILTAVYIDYNGEPVVISGRLLSTGIGSGAYMGLGGALLMSAAAFLEAVTAPRSRGVSPP